METLYVVDCAFERLSLLRIEGLLSRIELGCGNLQ
jgi:hypothetical protein